jgi:flagellar basal-body rod protein FlgB
MSIETYLFRRTTRQLVYKSLDANMVKSRAIAQNIANVSTPDYQRKEVNFEEQVRAALKKKINGEKTQELHQDLGRNAALKAVRPMTYVANDPTLAGEINNVDIDLEMAKLAENQIQYNFNIQFVGFDRFNAAVNGRVS